MEITLTPTIKQDIAWGYLNDDHTKIVGFGGGAGGGKSWLICEDQLIYAYRFPGYRGYIARNELKRLMASTYVTWNKVCKHHNIPESDWKLDGKYNIIKFKNGSTIDLLDIAFKPTDAEYERFGSLEYTRGAIEEAGETHFQAFDVLKTRTGRHNLFDTELNIMVQPPKDYETSPEKYPNIIEIKPKTLCTFNPSSTWIKRFFHIPYTKGELDSSVAYVPVLYSENPYVAKSYKAQLDGIVDEKTKRRLRDGDWDYDDVTNMLVSLDAVEDMFTNSIIESNDMYLTIDVARYGGDRIVFNVWKGWHSIKRVVKEKQGIDRTVQDARELEVEFKIPRSHVVVDDDGVGGGVSDFLKGCKSFVNNSSALKAKTIRRQIVPGIDTTVVNFSNLKSQAGFKLAEMIEDRKISITATALEKEVIVEEALAVMRQKQQGDDKKLALIPKDSNNKSEETVKGYLGRSPDIWDTFLFRAYFDLLKTGVNNGEVTSGLISNNNMKIRKFVKKGI